MALMGVKNPRRRFLGFGLFELISDFLGKYESQTIALVDVGDDIIDILCCLDSFVDICFESFVFQKLFLKEFLKLFFFVFIDEKKNDKTDKN